MSDFRSERTLGERIKALRKQRGIRSTNDLAELTNGAVSAWTLQNLESGRKQDMNVSALLNVAMALRVAPGYLLAPMSRPDERLDLVGLIAPFESMNVSQFDAWFSGLPDGAIRSASGDDRNERIELQALRELNALSRERRRLLTMLALEADAFSDSDTLTPALIDTTSKRLAETERHVSELSTYLTEAGWEMSREARSNG